MIPIRIDSRIRIALDALPAQVVEGLEAAFMHDNPAYSPTSISGAGEPTQYRTYARGEESITLPRGGMERVRTVLRENGLAWKVEDARTWAYPELEFPEHRLTPRQDQREMIAAGVQTQNCLLVAPTGCLTGETKIGVNRAGKGGEIRLDRLVRMFNGGMTSGPKWDSAIPTQVRAPMQDGTVRLCRLLAAVDSGAKPVYALMTDRGQRLHATLDHGFLTPFGWRPLGSLLIGDCVMVDVGFPKGRQQQKQWYRLRTLREHPFVGRKGVLPTKGGWTVPLHRLIAEARENGMELDEFVRAVRERKSLIFLDPKKWEVHHKDRNAQNNDPSNLEVLSPKEHRQVHLAESQQRLTAQLGPVRITSIEYAGEQPTYDLTVDVAHAFMAGGVAVHNSGKTVATFGILAALKRRSLVMVWTGNLLEQWRERCVEELGFEPGILRGDKDGGHPWLDLAMQQTVVSRFEQGDPELAHRYDVVVCDEVQRFAAPTLFASVDPFTARYRIGISADFTRKDGKEFLTRDLFGPVGYQVHEQTLVDVGAIVEVEICIVPTEFRAPWYRHRQDFNRLLAQMVADEKRNELALSIAQREIDAGEQVLLFTHRVEHARSIDAELVARGYPSGVMLGGTSQAEVFDRTKVGLREGTKRAGVGTYQAIAQGLNLPAVGRGVCITPIGGNLQQLGQTKGRLCRSAAGKDSGRLWYLHDRHVYGRKVIENLIKRFRVRALWNGEWIDGAEYVRRLRLTA